ncbi:MAG: aminotransferase class V-fold PLP-dependent enzyme [Proteobacteria bacterium]|nr:aminotransferase class V-fold PLP-dependent enzyme [Pseudomonadota bacterium]
MKLPHEIELPDDVPRHDPPDPGIDVVRARRETPGCAATLHLNNAGAALMPEAVVDAVIEHLRLEAALGGYEAAMRAEAVLNRAPDAAAALVGAARGEIALVESATRAWDHAFWALPLAAGDRILTGESEYASNFLAFLQAEKRIGIRIHVVPSDESGQISVAELENAIDDRTRLIAITHVPSTGGLVNPAAAIGRVANAAGIPYLLDACQSVGQMPIDVGEIGCDMLSATGRKYLRGPRGTGFLYVARALAEKMEPIGIDMNAADWVARDRYHLKPGAARFQNFEGNIAGRAGLCKAIEYARAWGLDHIQARIRHLAGRLREGLAAVPGATVRDLGVEQCGIVTFTIDGADSFEVADELRRQRIHIGVSLAGHARIDMDARGLPQLLRASVHYYNSDDELDRFLRALDAIDR